MDADEFESFQSADFESAPMQNDDKRHLQSAKLNDPYADMILAWYRQVESPAGQAVKMGALGAIPASILFFCIFFSNTTANLIAFSAFVISIFFIAFSIWMLGQILDNNCGTRAMQDVADPIREGSEGFFMT